MDSAFRLLVNRIGLPYVDAARMCATTPAAAMKLSDAGAIEVGKLADLAVLSRDLRVVQTFVSGQPALEPGT